MKTKAGFAVVAASLSLLMTSESGSGVVVTTRGLEPTPPEKPSEGRLPEDGGDIETQPNIAVEGYADNRYVYGEVEDLGKGEIAGYLYHPKGGKTYVYGEAAANMGLIYAYDANGRRYVLNMRRKGGRR